VEKRRDKSEEKMTNLQLTKPLAIIDIETTGLNVQEDRIIEISIIKLFPDGKEEILSSLINPEIMSSR
jgi:DNA polymerase-3 subunit epsilon